MNTENNLPIPARLPNGKANPEYAKAYRKKRAEGGNPIKQYSRPEGSSKKWNDSEKGKASAKKYLAKKRKEKKVVKEPWYGFPSL